MTYNITIDPRSRTSKLGQVTRALKTDIESGLLKEGQRLPSITVFAKTNGISRDTVEKAYRRLRRLGYVVSVNHQGH
ncbi:regulatory protein, gntR family [Mucilaginibacter pineti]|uniref:Regulatory protein, gntR family n=1 Tax=Mucilaginibacter pineti TaxID=1391627 RepID=A0A1G7II74_9SPHI|nr:winged helix-turn-helix domain-containing protein [Mucilaginibacter pineti]SDF12234.1 regulatory protein, gntR family [Mucilaginibacter pineti]